MVQHDCDQSLVLAYIYDTLYRGFTINVKELCRRFQYTESAIYKRIRIINANLSILGSPYKIEKVGTSLYKFSKNEFISIFI